jgi:hypothetical protein
MYNEVINVEIYEVIKLCAGEDLSSVKALFHRGNSGIVQYALMMMNKKR